MARKMEKDKIICKKEEGQWGKESKTWEKWCI